MKTKPKNDRLAELLTASVIGLVMAAVMAFCFTRVEPELSGLIITCSAAVGILTSWGLLKTWREHGME